MQLRTTTVNNEATVVNFEQADAVEELLRRCGLTVGKEVVQRILSVLHGESKGSLYDLYAHGRYRNGTERMPICGKGTAYKVKRLWRQGDLNEFQAYLDKAGQSQSASPTQSVTGPDIEAWQKDSRLPVPAASSDPIVVEARKKHFEMLTKVGEMLREDLDFMNHEDWPVMFGPGTKDVRVEIRTEFWKIEGVQYFDSFCKHVNNANLWSAYDQLKEDVVKMSKSVLENGEEESVVPFDRPPSINMQVIVPKGYPLKVAVPRGGMSLCMELPQSYEVLYAELTKVLARGITGGHCELCPNG